MIRKRTPKRGAQLRAGVRTGGVRGGVTVRAALKAVGLDTAVINGTGAGAALHLLTVTEKDHLLEPGHGQDHPEDLHELRRREIGVILGIRRKEDPRVRGGNLQRDLFQLNALMIWYWMVFLKRFLMMELLLPRKLGLNQRRERRQAFLPISGKISEHSFNPNYLFRSRVSDVKKYVL